MNMHHKSLDIHKWLIINQNQKFFPIQNDYDQTTFHPISITKCVLAHALLVGRCSMSGAVSTVGTTAYRLRTNRVCRCPKLVSHCFPISTNQLAPNQIFTEWIGTRKKINPIFTCPYYSRLMDETKGWSIKL